MLSLLLESPNSTTEYRTEPPVNSSQSDGLRRSARLASGTSSKTADTDKPAHPIPPTSGRSSLSPSSLAPIIQQHQQMITPRSSTALAMACGQDNFTRYDKLVVDLPARFSSSLAEAKSLSQAMKCIANAAAAILPTQDERLFRRQCGNLFKIRTDYWRSEYDAIVGSKNASWRESLSGMATCLDAVKLSLGELSNRSWSEWGSCYPVTCGFIFADGIFCFYLDAQKDASDRALEMAKEEMAKTLAEEESDDENGNPDEARESFISPAEAVKVFGPQ